MRHLIDAWNRRIASVSDYGGSHQPSRDGAPLSDLTGGGTVYPDDVYEHPEWYALEDEQSNRESIRVIKEVHGKPDAMVTIYRAVPPGVTQIETGNWVTISLNYARGHAMNDEDASHDWPVISAQVRASDVLCPGDSLNEYGYWGPSTSGRVAKIALSLAPYFHGTNADLKPGDHVVPGLGAVHGDDNDVVWVASNAWVASAYGSRTYQVEPDDEPRKRNKAGEFRCSGAVVIREVSVQEIRDASNAWAKMGALQQQVTADMAQPAGWKRTEYGYLSPDGQVFLERGAPMYGGGTAWMVWFRCRPEEIEVEEGVAGQWAWSKSTGDPVRSFEELTDTPGEGWYIHLNDAGSLQEAQETAAAVRQRRGAMSWPFTVEQLSEDMVVAKDSIGEVVGHLTWSLLDGMIAGIGVRTEHQRQGIATAMLEYARKIDPRIHHSDQLTDAGRAWSEKVGAFGDSSSTLLHSYLVEVEQRLREGNPYNYKNPDCGESSAVWYVVLQEHGIPVKMMMGSTPGGDEHVWLEVEGKVFDAVPQTNPGVRYEDGYEIIPNDYDWPSLEPYRKRAIATSMVASFGDSPEEAALLQELADAITAPSAHPNTQSIYGDESGYEGYGGVITQRSDGRLYLDGAPLQKLYRVVDPGEWADAQRNGFIQSDAASGSGYTRASAKPDERWRYHTRSGDRALTLEIDYDPSDGWHASAEGYAATHSRIPLSRVRSVR